MTVDLETDANFNIIFLNGVKVEHLKLADKYITQNGTTLPSIKKPDDTYKKLADKYILADGSKPQAEADYDTMMERTVIYGRPKLNLRKLQSLLSQSDAAVKEIADSFVSDNDDAIFPSVL